MQFQISFRRENDKEILVSSRFLVKNFFIRFLEKLLVNNFALSDAEDNTSGLLNRGGIADLPLFRTFAKSHKSHISGK